MAEFQIKIFSENLIILAEKFGGIKNFSETLNINAQILYNYTSGKREPKAGFLNKLAPYCDINWLLTGKQTETVKEPLLIYKSDIPPDDLEKENAELKKQLPPDILAVVLKAENYDLKMIIKDIKKTDDNKTNLAVG